MQKQLATGALAGALARGGFGAIVGSTGAASAADPTPATSATPTTPTTTNPTTPATLDGMRGMHGGPGGLDADDLTAAAKALGMTEADLTTALGSGKTAAAVATEKGVAVQTVIDAIVASDKAEFAAAVTAGTMTQAQADQLATNLTQHVTDEVNGVLGGHGFGGGRDGMHGGPGGLDADDLTAAAKALGMTEADLTAALTGGTTPAQVAADRGVAVQTVIDAIVASDSAELEAAVKAGTMTQAEADQRKATLTQHVTDEVNGVAVRPGFGGGMAPRASPAPSAPTGGGTSG